MEETQVAAPPAEGVPEGTGSQATAPAEQSAEQQQNAGQSPGRETAQPPSSESVGRPKPSEFYGFRKDIKRLQEALAERDRRFDELAKRFQAPAPQPQKQARPFDRDKFWNTPEEVLAEREKTIRDEIRNELKKELLEQEFPRMLTERDRASEFTRKQQEALELFFPKMSTDSKESLPERVAKDPAKAQRLQEILIETGLDEVSMTNPAKAAATALKLYELEVKSQAQAKKDPNVIKKSLVGSTATGASGGAKGPVTLEEIRKERAKLEKEKDANPQIMFDEDFRKRWNLTKELYSKWLTKE